MSELVELFISFARVGILTFGGGYAMLPVLEREVVERKQWATEAELMDYYAIGQCTPGVIAVNTATFIGQRKKGVAGAAAATLGVIFPSLVIIMLIAALISNFASLTWVQHAFAGIRVCVCVLIFNAVLKLWKKAVIDKPTFLIFVLVFAGSLLLSVSPAVFVILSGAAGILIRSLAARRNADNSGKGKEREK